MDSNALEACINHLTAAERLLEDAVDLPSLARLALVIDMLLRDHGLPDRGLLPTFADLVPAL